MDEEDCARLCRRQLVADARHLAQHVLADAAGAAVAGQHHHGAASHLEQPLQVRQVLHLGRAPPLQAARLQAVQQALLRLLPRPLQLKVLPPVDLERAGGQAAVAATRASGRGACHARRRQSGAAACLSAGLPLHVRHGVCVVCAAGVQRPARRR